MVKIIIGSKIVALQRSAAGGVESNMTDKSKPSALKPQSNADRLLKHLKADSLAQRLVQAHEGADGTDPIGVGSDDPACASPTGEGNL